MLLGSPALNIAADVPRGGRIAASRKRRAKKSKGRAFGRGP